MKKKTLKKRAELRAIGKDLRSRIIDDLARISKGLNPVQKVDAQVEYYFSCDNPARLILLEIFKKEEDKTLEEIAEYYNDIDSKKVA